MNERPECADQRDPIEATREALAGREGKWFELQSSVCLHDGALLFDQWRVMATPPDVTIEDLVCGEPLRDRIQAAMDEGLQGVWAEYPDDCERALDLVMVIVNDVLAAALAVAKKTRGQA